MIELKTLFIAVHLIGVVLGLGAASIADFYIYKSARAKSVSQLHIDSVKMLSSIVTVGLALTLASGIAFIVRYYCVQPEMLLNPKLHAKLFIVLLLAFNAIYIHRIVLPRYYNSFQHNLISSLSRNNLLCFITSAAVSVTGWWWSFFLGVARELNFTYPTSVFLYLYFASIATVFCVGIIATLVLKNGRFNSGQPAERLYFRQTLSHDSYG